MSRKNMNCSGDQSDLTTTNPDVTRPNDLRPRSVTQQPWGIGPVSTLEDMNIKLLQFQQREMKPAIETHKKLEEGLSFRVEQLETRQTQADTVMSLTNRYWSQLNENISALLQRFNDEISDEFESDNEDDATYSLVTKLTTWGNDELNAKLVNLVEVSMGSLAKIIQAFDRVQQRSEKVATAVNADKVHNVENGVKETYIQLEEKNRSLQAVNINLYQQFYTISLKMKELSYKLGRDGTKRHELKNALTNLSNELPLFREKNERLQEEFEKYWTQLQLSAKNEVGNEVSKEEEDMSAEEIANLEQDIKELKELGENRLAELENQHHIHEVSLAELEKLKMDIQHLPDSVVVESAEYKCLQSKYSAMCNESDQRDGQLTQIRQAKQQLETHHNEDNNRAKREELMVQKKLRKERTNLEDKLGKVGKEYEMLWIEFERNVNENEKAGPMCYDLSYLISTCQLDNKELKEESQAMRQNWTEISLEIEKLKIERDDLKMKLVALFEKDDVSRVQSLGSSEPSSSSGVKMNLDDLPDSTMEDIARNNEVKNQQMKEEDKSPQQESASTKLLRSQLRKVQNEQRESKLLLDMYKKGVSKEEQERVELMAQERKNLIEMEELKKVLAKYESTNRVDKKKLADDEATKKIQELEELASSLRNEVAVRKLEDTALMNELDKTVEACSGMLEQNCGLISEVRKKADANYSLLSDRIKEKRSEQLAQELCGAFKKEIDIVSEKLEAQSQVIQKLKEKERLVVKSISAMESEISLRSQASECFRRKTIETAKYAADHNTYLEIEECRSQIKDAIETIIEKSCGIEDEAYKARRLEEEITSIKRKSGILNLELDGSSEPAETLSEEIRGFTKDKLLCPECKVRVKNAFLKKCFHVFCIDCLKSRCETNRMECPKCNTTFGANDFHTFYLT